MADTKTTALTELTAPVSTDIIPIVDDPGGSAATKKITLANLFSITGRVLISEQTPTGTGTVTWSSIPATYKSLEIEYICRGTEVANSVLMSLYFNNDSTAGNYRKTSLAAYGASTVAADVADSATISTIAAASATAGNCTAGVIKIINYADTNFNKQTNSFYSLRVDASGTGVLIVTLGHTWESTAAINRIDLVLSAANYDTGSTLRLYGVY